MSHIKRLVISIKVLVSFQKKLLNHIQVGVIIHVKFLLSFLANKKRAAQKMLAIKLAFFDI